jgi:hypothetical protein
MSGSFKPRENCEQGQLLCGCFDDKTCVTTTTNVCVANVCVKASTEGDCLGCQCTPSVGCTNFACLPLSPGATESVCAIDSGSAAGGGRGAPADFGGLGLGGVIGVALGGLVVCIIIIVVVVVLVRKNWDTSLNYRDVEPVAVISSRLSASTPQQQHQHQHQQHARQTFSQQQHHQQPSYAIGGQDLTPEGLPPPAYSADGRPRESAGQSMHTAQTGTINNFYGNITLSQRAW